MRRWIQLLILVPAISGANVCDEVSPLSQQFEKQKKWREISVKEPSVKGAVEGLVDRDNNFYIYSLGRKDNFEAKIEVDVKNEGYKNFYRFCRSEGLDRQDVATLREAGQENKYVFTGRYLPSLTEFSNDPYRGIKTSSYELRIDYKPGAVLNQIHDGSEVQAKVYRSLFDQLNRQKKVGVTHLDLTGMDDFVCDLMHGDATLEVYRRMGAKSPIVEKEEVVSLGSVREIYQEWKASEQKGSSSKEALFYAGTVFGKMKAESRLSDLNAVAALSLLDKFMNPQMQFFKKLSMNEVQCAADSMQSFREPYIKHLVNTQFYLNKDIHLYGKDI